MGWTVKAARRAIPVALMVIAGSMSAAQGAGLKVVVFDVEPVQMPRTPQIEAKLKAEGDLLRKLVGEKGLTVVDTTPQAKKIAEHLPLSQCNGCDQDIAAALGADIEIATAMQAVSAATFTLSGSLKDVKTDRVLRQGVVDLRGDNADTWIHGMKFLLKERLLDPPLPANATELAATVDAAGKATGDTVR